MGDRRRRLGYKNLFFKFYFNMEPRLKDGRVTRLLLFDSADASLLGLERLIGQPEPGVHVLQEDEMVSVLDVTGAHSLVIREPRVILAHSIRYTL